ncbi:TonB-dependent receptor plug domain-containing protein [Hyphobacterium sp.]|uniref:TonB-dependent receptor plug domain-containing protein n=1 Tax=Hyphobacterium sp. TaxID=2004662 RepID=UPI00374A2390
METQMKVFERRSGVSLKTLALSSCAAVAMASTFGGSVAFAQDGATDDRIIVTGSRIGRSELTSVSPITVVGADDLNVQAVRTLEDFADQITFAPGGETNSRVNNGSGGQATISLRGLGPNRTLVLVNGRRVTPANTGGTADLNFIPVSLIGRVEVLRDGASTVYGSDAIAGVVNIITRDDVEGFEAFAQYDVTSEGDGQIYRYGATFGRSFDGGRFTANVEYFDRGTILQGDRPFSACPWAEQGGQLICGGSGTAYPGQIFGNGANSPNFTAQFGNGGAVLDPATNTLRAFTPADGFNFAERSYMVTPMEVWTGFFDAEYDVMNSDRFGQATAFGEFMYAARASEQQLAPVGTFWSPLVPAFHPGNPTGESVFVARRLAELDSGRFFTQDASSWRSIFGLEGMLPAGIFWDTSLSYGRYVDARVIDGQVNPVRAAQVLCNDPASLAAGACQTPANLIWDPFRRDTLTDAIANYMLVRHSPVGRTTRLSYQANLSGDLGGLQLPGGEIGWAVGYERRRDTGEFIPDGAAQIGQIYFVSGNATQGDITSQEFYGEVRLPILSGVEFAEILAVELSARSSSYDVNGTNVSNSFDSNTYSIKAEWAPNDQVRIRGSYSTGFRAPSIAELFSPQAQSAVQYTDPCVNYGTSGVSATTIANCQADGIASPSFTLTSTQASGVTGGNPNLTPEESTGYTFGVVFTPSGTPILEDFTFSADYFSFEITDAIGSADVNTIASQCYASANFSDPLCALIAGPGFQIGGTPLSAPFPGPGGARRGATGVLAGVLITNANLSTYETSGVDIGIDYSGPTFDIFESTAQFVAGLDVTYLESFAYQVLPGGAVSEYAGAFAQDPFTTNPAAFPEITALLRLGVVGDNWQFNYVGRYLDEVTAFSPSGGLSDTAERVMYHDVQAAYNFVDAGVGLTFGVRNLANETPPYVTNNDDMNTLNQTYDTAGRYFYGRITISR